MYACGEEEELNFTDEMQTAYHEFFEKLGVDEKTGVVKDSMIKFATYPFIGSRYGQLNRILFIGMDVGSDEHDGITSLNQRRKDIEYRNITQYNPHISGTYLVATYHQREFEQYRLIADLIDNSAETSKAFINNNFHKLNQIINPLAYCSLTNYYKFVTVNRANKAGNLDRKHINWKYEDELLLREIEILSPDIILFQSLSFMKKKDFIDRIDRKVKKVIMYHPSAREKGRRICIKMIKESINI